MRLNNLIIFVLCIVLVIGAGTVSAYDYNNGIINITSSNESNHDFIEEI